MFQNVLYIAVYRTFHRVFYRVFYKIYKIGRSISRARGSSIRYVPGIQVAFYEVFLRVFYMNFF